MTALSTGIPSKEYRRFARFLAVGMLGTILDFGTLSQLKALGLATLPANSLSFSAGVANNFLLNRAWTFREGMHSDWRRQLLQFTSVSLVGLALNNALVLLLEVPLGEWLRIPEFGYLPAKVIATGVVVFWNYLLNRNWTFKPSSADER